jgi:hypothetical protein
MGAGGVAKGSFYGGVHLFEYFLLSYDQQLHYVLLNVS